MPPVAIVTDTCQYLPRDVVAENDIHLVSLYVNWQGRQDRESDLADLDGYYDHLRSASELPTTSQPSVGDFLAVYEPLVDAGRQVVSIHLSAALSGTYETALRAKASIEETRTPAPGRNPITVLDSATAAGGEGIMVLGAATAARAGLDAEGVVEQALRTRKELKMWFCIDTLEFLRRGGRVGAARAWLGSTLRIKPILTLEAEITPVERVRTSGRAFERMADYLRALHDDGADGWVVQHIQAVDQAERLIERGRELFDSEPLFVSEVGPVIGTHVGPGLLGCGGVPRSLVS